MTAAVGVLRAAADHLVGPKYYDARVQDWPLTDWRVALVLTVLYVAGVQAGVRYMRDRKPVNVAAFAQLHNLCMTLLSLWMTVETVTQARALPAWRLFGWGRPGGDLWGNVVEQEQFSSSGRRLAVVIWVHYISKVYEFVDTAIMVLKKNNRQITLLHVYHHASTFFPCWWSAVNFAPGGDVWFLCALNSSVHVAMYGYYFASSSGMRVSQGVKKSITIMQLIQFVLLMSQALYGTFWATHYRPRIVVELAILQAFIFICLFANFYRKAYMAKKEHLP